MMTSNQGLQVALRLEQAGMTAEQAQAIIASPGNGLAKAMMEALPEQTPFLAQAS